MDMFDKATQIAREEAKTNRDGTVSISKETIAKMDQVLNPNPRETASFMGALWGMLEATGCTCSERQLDGADPTMCPYCAGQEEK